MSVNYNEIKFEGDICNFPDSPRPQAVSVKGRKKQICFIAESLPSNKFIMLPMLSR